MSTWREADRAYLEHHATCGECTAAGMSRTGLAQRCQAGKVLWKAYQAAGRPPHFRWPVVAVRTTPMQVKPPRP